MSTSRSVSTKPARTNLLRPPTSIRAHRIPGPIARPAGTSATKLPTASNRSTVGIPRSSVHNKATAPTFATIQKTRSVVPVTPPCTPPNSKAVSLPLHSSDASKPPPAKAKPSSIFIGPHTWTPCTPGSLTHSLSTCAHKVMTQDAEACAPNCLRRDCGSDEELNIRNLDKAFICPVCRDAMFAQDLEGKKANLAEYLNNMKALLGIEGQRWTDWEAMLVKDSEETWLAEEKVMRDALEKHGRTCGVVGGVVGGEDGEKGE